MQKRQEKDEKKEARKNAFVRQAVENILSGSGDGHARGRYP